MLPRLIFIFCRQVRSLNSRNMRLLTLFLGLNLICLFGIGRRRVNKSIDPADIEGKCFWNDQWATGLVTLQSGKEIKVPKVKLNLFSNAVHFVDLQGVEHTFIPGAVTRVVFFDSQDTTQ